MSNSRQGRRPFGDGGIDQRGENVFRLRYRTGGKRFSKTIHGSLTDARKALRALIRAGDTGEHVDPSKITVREWITKWLEAGAPGRRRKKVSERTLERYGQLLRTHAVPALGTKRVQQLHGGDIDGMYAGIEAKGDIAPRTAHHLHVVLGACLATAHRKGLIANNPMLRVEQVPNPDAQMFTDESDDIGDGLDEAELAFLIAGFQSSAIYPIVVAAAATGARRNELLALRWTDLDIDRKTLRIERAWEQTKKFGLRLKPPKTKRGLRTIELDDETIGLLRGQKELLQRIAAGIPDGASVDLSLVKLPPTALIFPAIPKPGDDFDFNKPRDPRNFSKEFARRADIVTIRARSGVLPDFGKTRFHDLRGIHSTALLDAGIPVHTVAQRIGDDPAVLLRNYAKRKRSKKADASVTHAIAALAASFLK